MKSRIPKLGTYGLMRGVCCEAYVYLTNYYLNEEVNAVYTVADNIL